jgi:hypothetical protein
MTDRRIVELLVLPALLAALIRSIRDGVGEPGVCLDGVVGLLDSSLREPLEGLDSKRTDKLVRRAMRVISSAMNVLTAEPIPYYSVQWYAVARFIVVLTEKEFLTVAEGSVFARAWDSMLALGFGNVASEDEEAHAERMAAEIRRVLARDGLFT